MLKAIVYPIIQCSIRRNIPYPIKAKTTPFTVLPIKVTSRNFQKGYLMAPAAAPTSLKKKFGIAANKKSTSVPLRFIKFFILV